MSSSRELAATMITYLQMDEGWYSPAFQYGRKRPSRDHQLELLGQPFANSRRVATTQPSPTAAAALATSSPRRALYPPPFRVRPGLAAQALPSHQPPPYSPPSPSGDRPSLLPHRLSDSHAFPPFPLCSGRASILHLARAPPPVAQQPHAARPAAARRPAQPLVSPTAALLPPAPGAGAAAAPCSGPTASFPCFSLSLPLF
ncbi:hypothetical protein NL676_001787 [Syzygium grande]|nr:hypothetical protein NL676_001787 [Syzygium grande]